MKKIGVVCFGALWVLAGCSFLTPGFDTRQAAEQRKETTYDADKNLTIKENTTQNNRTVMVESDAKDGATVTFNSDGSPATVEHGTTILTQVSEPKDVMEGYMRLAEKNAEVAARMFGAIENLTSMIVPVLRRPTTPEAPQPPSLLDELKVAMKQMIREAIAAQTRPGP